MTLSQDFTKNMRLSKDLLSRSRVNMIRNLRKAILFNHRGLQRPRINSLQVLKESLLGKELTDFTHNGGVRRRRSKPRDKNSSRRKRNFTSSLW